MRSAEFRRNLWLELSPQRLIALPLIVLVLVLMNQVANRSDPGGLAELGTWIFYLVVFLWGSRRAAGAMAEEVNGNTWAGQRLSALSPAALALGKLFGATAFIWYGGLIGLGLFAFGSLAEGTPPLLLSWELLQRLALGVLLHAVALALSLLLLNKRRQAQHLGTTLPQLLALGGGLLLVGLFGRFSILSSIDLWNRTTDWYGVAYDTVAFVAVSALVFALWAVLAGLRLMATQLQRQLMPWAWPAFTLFAMAYVQGFYPEAFDRGLGGPLVAPLGVALVFFYAALFAERNEPLRYRQCLAGFRGAEPRRGLALLPWWLIGWLILLAAVLWRGIDPAIPLGFWGELAGELDFAVPQPFVAELGLAAFALRDAAFVLWINAGGSQRGDLVAFIYLLVLYGPLLSLMVGLGAWEAIALLAPVPSSLGLVAPAAALLQAAVLAFLTWRRWQALFRP